MRFLSSVVAPEISVLIQYQQVCRTVDLQIYLPNAQYTCLALVKEKPSRQISGFVRSTYQRSFTFSKSQQFVYNHLAIR
jgi:hypothetical protein